MQIQKRILLGLHNEQLMQACIRMSKALGYTPNFTSTLEEMENFAKANNYEYPRILMDINLEAPGTIIITPLQEIQTLFAKRIEQGLTRLIGISGNEDTVKLAKKAGFLARSKYDFNFMEFLKD